MDNAYQTRLATSSTVLAVMGGLFILTGWSSFIGIMFLVISFTGFIRLCIVQRRVHLEIGQYPPLIPEHIGEDPTEPINYEGIPPPAENT